MKKLLFDIEMLNFEMQKYFLELDLQITNLKIQINKIKGEK